MTWLMSIEKKSTRGKAAVETEQKCCSAFSLAAKKGRREAEKGVRRQKCIYEFSDLLTVLKGSARFRDSFVLGRTAGCASHHGVALYPSFLIRVHHPRGVLFSFASLLYLSLFLLSLLVSSSLYKSKDEPRCYVYLSLHIIASFFFGFSFPLSLAPASSRSQCRPPAPCTASDDALYAAPVILLASILLASAFSVVQGLPKRASRFLRRGRERKGRSVRKRGKERETNTQQARREISKCNKVLYRRLS